MLSYLGSYTAGAPTFAVGFGAGGGADHRLSASSWASCASGAYASGTPEPCTAWQMVPMSPLIQVLLGYLRSIALRNALVAYTGSVTWADVPHPMDGRCWYSPRLS